MLEAPTPNANDAPATVETDAPIVTPVADPTPVDDAGDSTILGGGDPNAEAKPEGDTPAGPPEKYELTAAEGQTFDAATFEAVEPTLRELGLSNDQAQKLVSAYADKIIPQMQERANSEAMTRAVTQRKEWADAFEADPDIGGANKPATIAAAAKAFDHYGLKAGEGFRQLLDESGLGNHPDLIRFIAKVGNDLAEGSFERGTAASQPKQPEQALYAPAFQPKT